MSLKQAWQGFSKCFELIKILKDTEGVKLKFVRILKIICSLLQRKHSFNCCFCMHFLKKNDQLWQLGIMVSISYNKIDKLSANLHQIATNLWIMDGNEIFIFDISNFYESQWFPWNLVAFHCASDKRNVTNSSKNYQLSNLQTKNLIL